MLTDGGLKRECLTMCIISIVMRAERGPMIMLDHKRLLIGERRTNKLTVMDGAKKNMLF